jgi:hypothetical protein
MNPHWDDLAEQWSEVYKPMVPGNPREISRPAGENAGLRDDAIIKERDKPGSINLILGPGELNPPL